MFQFLKTNLSIFKYWRGLQQGSEAILQSTWEKFWQLHALPCPTGEMLWVMASIPFLFHGSDLAWLGCELWCQRKRTSKPIPHEGIQTARWIHSRPHWQVRKPYKCLYKIPFTCHLKYYVTKLTHIFIMLNHLYLFSNNRDYTWMINIKFYILQNIHWQAFLTFKTKYRDILWKNLPKICLFPLL